MESGSHRFGTLDPRSRKLFSSVSLDPSLFNPKQNGFSNRQISLLMLCMMAIMLCSMTYSIQIPFYPKEASRYEVSASQYGLVFGVYELFVVIGSLVCGRYMNTIGTKFCFISGLFVTGVSCTVFGFLDQMPDQASFLAFSHLCRMCEAVGQAMTIVGLYTMVQCEFKENVGSVTSWVNTFFGIGMIIGPSAGGVLYEVGGFTLPFVSTGVLIILSSAAASCMFPEDTVSTEVKENNVNVLKVICIPSFWLGASMVTLSMVCSGYLQATLEPHLRIFQMAPSILGLIFIVYGVVYTIMNPLWGKLLDHQFLPANCMLLGIAFMCIGFSLIGPFPFIPVDQSVLLSTIGLVFIGLACSAIHTPALVHMKNACTMNGIKETPELFSLVSGIWTSSFSMGGFVGPLIGGVLFDFYGFRRALIYIIAMCLIMCVLLVSYIVRYHFYPRRHRMPTYHFNPMLESIDERTPIYQAGDYLPPYDKI